MAKQTRGIRNNNPGNIRKGCNWIGLAKEQKDKSFCQFITMNYGLRALVVTLRTYVLKHKKTTVSLIINRWAPESDGNNTTSYIKQCALAIGDVLAPLQGITNREQTGLNYQFSSKNFGLTNGYPSLVLYALVKTICKIESQYELSYSDFIHVIKLL